MRLRVTGVVQGVGFRPFVHRLATSLDLHGTVRNDAAGVLIDVFGPAEVLDEFVRRVAIDAPPLASVTGVAVVPDDSALAVADGFRIIASDDAATAAAAITALPPDVAVCDECLAEMRDPADRRYRYPFVTCTQCGPRFTITRHLPYDRPTTTMAGFVLCPACQAEYDDPTDRRYHAQPLACPTCGPHLTLHTADGVVAERDDALRGAQRLIDDGRIVAVKGIGGYHLVCDATNATAVATLRARKGRGAKPFAVLVADRAPLAEVAAVSATEQSALVSPQRPIVLLRRTPGAAGWPELVAPGAADVGVMLPSSPVQHLLLDGLGTQVVVCTSGNVADEPIVTDDGDALRRLREIADAWLTNDRPIHSACDDSIVRARGPMMVPLRRARGFTPLPVPLASDGRAVLAMGGDLKGSLCLAVGRQAFMSQHLGDHGQLATYRAARQAARQLVDLLCTTPAAVAIDAHPGYLSARLGRELAGEWGVPVVEVQHHHAHVVSVMAEHGVHGPVIGVAFDGTGYGPDGTIWGGEIMLATAASVTRVAHLKAIPLPGGDAAIEHPARTALAHLWAAGVEWDPHLAAVAAVAPADRQVLRTQLERGVHTVATSSMGRLFDAVAALAGVRQRVDYEAQAAIELEAVLDPLATGAYTFPLADAAGAVDCAPVIRAVAADALAGTPAGTISARFHSALVSHVVHQVRTSACDTSAGTGGTVVVLSGGVFQNAWLADACEAVLVREGCTVLTHRLVPTNDGGLALGQAVIARALLGGNG
ncbi:MAG: carbamoyltransferase HypF [Actinomycetota bacterium]|nr:carbamoyltransferase HypF [Actinomycetota bacterium]